MNRPFVEPSVEAISAVDAANRIGSKGRKRRAISDAGWEEVWFENLEKYGIRATREIKETEETLAPAIEPETPEEFPKDAEQFTKLEMKFEEIITAIRKMADDPEKLVESHLGVFVDPAPPGRLLNSQG
ncbi:MAG: hypothetical protein LBT08_10125 [Synergistaceae bacterium]|nr:hypothetical protein [Synergistaceae bacterium]